MTAETPSEELLQLATGPAAGFVLLDARQKLDVSQKAFGELLGVGQTTIDGWEKGYRRPPVNALILAARRMGVPLEEALRGPGLAKLREDLKFEMEKREGLPPRSTAAKSISRRIARLRRRIQLTEKGEPKP